MTELKIRDFFVHDREGQRYAVGEFVELERLELTNGEVHVVEVRRHLRTTDGDPLQFVEPGVYVLCGRENVEVREVPT